MIGFAGDSLCRRQSSPETAPLLGRERRKKPAPALTSSNLTGGSVGPTVSERGVGPVAVSGDVLFGNVFDVTNPAQPDDWARPISIPRLYCAQAHF